MSILSMNQAPPTYDDALGCDGLVALTQQPSVFSNSYPPGSTVLYQNHPVTIDSWVDFEKIKLTTGAILSIDAIRPIFNVGDPVLVSDPDDEKRRYFDATVIGETESRISFQWKDANQGMVSSVEKTDGVIRRILPEPNQTTLDCMPLQKITIYQRKNEDGFFLGYNLDA